METRFGGCAPTLARREGGRGRRFAPELRHQITVVGRGCATRARAGSRIGREIGLPAETVRRLCEAAPGFVAVEVVDDAVRP